MLGEIIAVINSCKQHCMTIGRAQSSSRDASIVLELSQLIAYFSYCKRVVHNLIDSSKGTAELVQGD